jgi:broad specificity phosphatase PhoE
MSTKVVELSSPNPVSLIASHNSRIQCFLDKFKKTEKQVRFKNCAVLRMELTPAENERTAVKISMVYPGELEVNEQQKDKVYYTIASSDNIQSGGQKTPLEKCEINKLTCLKNTCKNKKILEVEFADIVTVIDEKTLRNLLNLKPSDIKYKYVFYIARHGQAEHNLYPAIQIVRKKDTSLTAPIGILQAINAGMALSKVMKSYNETTVNYTFCSDLLRTRQTLLNIYKGFKSTTEGKEIKLPDKMTVLPCTNELSYFKNANCDALTAKDAGAKFAAENFPACDMKQIKVANPCRQMKDEEGKVDTGIKINVDWSFYTPFYGDAFRNTRKKGRLHCRNTNMIAMAVKYISENSTALSEFVNERKTDSKKNKSKGGKTRMQTKRIMRTKKNKKSNKQTRKLK